MDYKFSVEKPKICCMCMSQTLIVGAQQESVVKTHCDKEDVTEEGGHMELGYYFSGTDILVLAPGDKNNTVQNGRGESRPPKPPEKKQETCVQVGENLSVKR